MKSIGVVVPLYLKVAGLKGTRGSIATYNARTVIKHDDYVVQKRF